MGQANVIRKFFQPPLGMDLRLGPMNRKMEMCRDMLNVDIIETLDGDSLGTRKGSQYIAGGFTDAAYFPALSDGVVEGIRGAIGLLNYDRIVSTSGARTTEILLAQDHLYRMAQKTITFTYTGAGVGAVRILPKLAGNVAQLTLVDSAGLTTQVDLGNVYAVAADYTLETLEGVVNPLAAWSMTIGSGREGYTSAALGPVTTISVDNGAGAAHNLLVGDMVRIPLAAGGNTYRRITAVNAASTNISFNGLPITVADNAYIRLALVDYSASLLGQFVLEGIAPAGTATPNILEWESIYSVHSLNDAPFLRQRSYSGAREFVPLTFQNMINNLYISCPLELEATSYLKYDGQNIYRAGMPKADTPGVGPGAVAGAVDAGAHTYIVVFSHTDARGNTIEGMPSDVSGPIIAAGGGSVNVTISSYPLRYSDLGGFMNNYARARGAGIGVTTIVVDGLDTLSDHCLHVGDSAFFYDAVSATYVTRTVTAATYNHDGTGGTISISGAAVNIADDAHITNNLKANIYRTMVGGFDYFLVASVPVEVELASWIYVDTIADASLGAQFLVPDVNEEHGLAPIQPISMTSYQGSIILAGFLSEPNDWAHSLPGQPEYFPDNLRAEVGKEPDDSLRGVAVLGPSLIFFKQYSSYILSGTLLDAESLLPQWRMDVFSSTVGCTSHKSIVSADNMLFWMDQNGPHSCSSDSPPIFIGEAVSPMFTASRENSISGGTPGYALHFASSLYDKLGEKIIMNVPLVAGVLGTVFRFSESGNTSVAFVYDIRRSNRLGFPIWRIWDQQAMSVGSVVIGNDIYQAHNHVENSVTASLLAKKLNNNYTIYQTSVNCFWQDYWDNYLPISWRFATGWEDLEDPETAKIFKRLAIFGPQITEGTKTNSVYFSFNVSQRDNYNSASSWSLWAGLVISNMLGGLGLPAAALLRRVLRLRFRPTKAKSVELQFSGAGDGGSKVQIMGWELEAVAPYRPRIGRRE